MERYQKLLQAGERVEWVYLPTKRSSFIFAHFFSILVYGMILFLIYALFNIYFHPELAENVPGSPNLDNNSVISNFRAPFVFSMILLLMVGLGKLFSSIDTNVVFTNSRIIFNTFFIRSRIRSFPYNNIEDVEKGISYAYIVYQQDGIRNKVEIINHRGAHQVINKYWNPERHSMEMHKEIKYFATSYELDYQENFGQENQISITGKINDVPVEFNYKTEKDKLFFTADVHLKNKANNSLYLEPENITTNIAKIFGKQDIKVGSRRFDKFYLIQSNNETFTEYILNESLRDDIMQERLLTGQLRYGNPEAKKNATSDELLDDIMLLENQQQSAMFHYQQKIRIEKHHQKDFFKALTSPRNQLDLLVKIAMQIKEY